jgi:hypothetical protein
MFLIICDCFSWITLVHYVLSLNIKIRFCRNRRRIFCNFIILLFKNVFQYSQTIHIVKHNNAYQISMNFELYKTADIPNTKNIHPHFSANILRLFLFIIIITITYICIIVNINFIIIIVIIIIKFGMSKNYDTGGLGFTYTVHFLNNNNKYKIRTNKRYRCVLYYSGFNVLNGIIFLHSSKNSQ